MARASAEKTAKSDEKAKAPAPAKSAAAGPKRLYLIDGSGYIFRAYHALPPLSRSDGTPTGAVSGFCNMLAKLLDDIHDEGDVGHLAVIFDAGRRTFRNDIYPDYKAHRPEPPEDLVPQFALIRDATRAFNVSCIEMPGFEADDLIATYARLAEAEGYSVVIVSSDKDLMQLVTDGVSMLDPIKQRRIGAAEVEDKFGVGPDKVVEVQALAGDSVDNVPGVPGIGVKTAAELINTYGDLDTLLARADEIKQPKRRERLIENAEDARVSLELVRLRVDVPLEDGIDSFEIRAPEPEVLFTFLAEMELTRLATRLKSRTEDGATPAVAVASAPPAGDIEYLCVQTLDDLKRWIAEATYEGFVAVDTETTSLEAPEAELVGASLAIKPGRACYIPLGHGAPEGGAAPDQIPFDDALKLLKGLLEDPAVLKIGQNIKYDMVVLKRYGLAVAPVDDTMLLSFALDAGRHNHGMDELAVRHLEHKTISYSEVAGSGKSQVTFDQVPLDKAVAYAAEDADITLKLHGVLKPRILAEHVVRVYETIERPLIPVLAMMESTGIRVDPALLKTLSKDFAKRAGKLEAEIHKLAGHEFNVGSPKQLGEVLFDEMGLSGGKKGKTGAYGTGADVLEGLAAEGHDLPTRVLDWRQLTKLKNTYTDALHDQVNAATGRVHTNYHMAGAATGRLASNDPNLQNIPIRTEEGRKIRRAFIPDKGHTFLSADYSQIELRLLAHIADIATLREAFHEGLDIHALTASQVFDVPIEGMEPGVRRSAKAINFGIIYGISAFGLGRQLGIPRADAAAYIEAYFERYPGIRDYMEKTKAFCHQHGYVETIFGRRCHLPGINDKNAAHRAFSERAAINAPLQGSAADIIKRAMIRMPEALAGAKLSARMLLTVHDELLFEVPDKEIDKTAEVVKEVMEAAAHLSVPLTVDIGTGANWDEAH